MHATANRRRRSNVNTNDVPANQAHTFFIDYNPADTVFVTATGNDTTGTGLTPASPLATVGKGLQVAQTNTRSR